MINQLPITSDKLAKLPARTRDCHKGQLGHALIIAGTKGMGGAGLLASQSCLRLGAGIVSLATDEMHIAASLARQPEIMVHGVKSAEDLPPLLAQADVVLIGPGLGQSTWSHNLLHTAIQKDTAHIWDADALNLLARAPSAFFYPKQWVLTPHPGEAARLLQISTTQVQAARAQAAQTIANRYRAVVILKGAHSLIASPHHPIHVCPHGHPVMAGPGFGDVLSGVICALIAQGMALFEASCLAVYLHAKAGEICATQGRGVVASDLLLPMRQLLEAHSPVFIHTD